ncbi:MAG: bifunctional phosphopantothenoylcysteine decarboxylase/phosphopantothenate--cysteine ligase CoaBC [Oleiphilaceae bacterium]|nr:bifunctional phosphopantothenoylcysteine decarboxylase/phosphopantothenate--cysteine ligase CoaBC [Oleiphilaceae bacterium]
MALQDCNIVLGVSGGIAAYKSADLCRQLKKNGAKVRVVMTQGACAFIQPLTFQALSGEPVSTALLDEDAEAGMGHIELAKWADLILIAPASANCIARIANGFADDLLTTLVLATEAQIAIAPAMNQVMWANPITQKNLQNLIESYEQRLQIVGPASGEQACGDVGFGRMMEPSDIVAAISQESTPRECKYRVVITAGPTREAIDPVRYISNHSSGKMGYALAEAFHAVGADVCLISGPVNLSCSSGIERIDVTSAEQMYEQAMRQARTGLDVFIGSAAVADYRPIDVSEQKMKKTDFGDNIQVELTQNPDIIANVSAMREISQSLIVGFAAETNDVIQYAKSKLKRKSLDVVIANDVSNQEIGFNSDNNEVTLVTVDGEELLPLTSKASLAQELVTRLSEKLNQKRKSK